MRRNNPVLFVVGCMFIIAAPPVAILPGPAGTVSFMIGLGLVLRNSRAAKRHYARFGRRWPQYGRWVDWAMRRQSARRRKARARAQAQAQAQAQAGGAVDD
jgi:hypothetical protein